MMWSIMVPSLLTQAALIGVSATSILPSTHSRSTVQAAFNDFEESRIPPVSQSDIHGFIHRYNFSHPEAAALWNYDARVKGADIWMDKNEYAELFIPEHISKTLGKPYGAGYTTRPITIPAPPRSSRAEHSLSSTIGLNSSYHDDYRDLSDLAAFTKSLVSDTPDLVTRRVYGHSFEGRPLEVLHVSQPNTTIKGSVVVLGPQHGREWVATASATYLLHALLTPKNETGSLAELLDHHDFYIIPTPNPDGYDYTWTSDRLWYKNRQSTGSRLCSGIDLARNWDFKWRKYATGPGFAESDEEDNDEESDDLGSDKESEDTLVEPCSSGYPGIRPFEAPETSALDVFLRTLPATTTGPAISAFIELRSYGQLISTPYGHSCKRTPRDAEDQLELAQGAGHVASRLYGTGFTVGRACATRFRAGGNALDYVYSRVGVKFAYTVHLRDTGTFGFALPKEMIRPVGEETAEMVAYLARFVRER